MIGDKFMLKFSGDKAFLTESKAIPLEGVALPSHVKWFATKAYWMIRLLGFDAATKTIFAEIESYRNGSGNFPENQLLQKEQLQEVDKIRFRNINTNGLLSTLYCKHERIENEDFEENEFEAEPDDETENDESTERPFEELVSKTYIIKDHFSVPIKNLRFQLGGVSFEKKINQLDESVVFIIPNYDIREEFDAVKNYFSNVLKTKSIAVSVEIEVVGNEITATRATSSEIARIDQKLVENVKIEFVKEIAKKKIHAEIDKNLFTMDELFDTLSEEQVKSNTFYNSESELVNDLLQITSTKHYKHLRFLSANHQHAVMKLRFVLRPFSFIFLLEGRLHYHIVWETLDTREATYIWHTEKDFQKLKATFRKVEDIINVIKVQGKIAYINSSDDGFRRIFHEYSELVDGFVKWKFELENILT